MSKYLVLIFVFKIVGNFVVFRLSLLILICGCFLFKVFKNFLEMLRVWDFFFWVVVMICNSFIIDELW